VIRLGEDETPLGRDARHYADLATLANTPDVKQMLASEEYAVICRDYDEKSKDFFAKYYRPPDGLLFRDSPALFPSDELRAKLVPEYERECGRLFPRGEFPPFDLVLDRFREIRALV